MIEGIKIYHVFGVSTNWLTSSYLEINANVEQASKAMATHSLLYRVALCDIIGSRHSWALTEVCNKWKIPTGCSRFNMGKKAKYTHIFNTFVFFWYIRLNQNYY